MPWPAAVTRMAGVYDALGGFGQKTVSRLIGELDRRLPR